MRLISLFENNRASVFHGTNENAAVNIIESNRLNGVTEHRFLSGRAFKSRDVNKYDNVEGVSLTRSIYFAKRWKDGNGVVFELDTNKLRQKYRIVQIDYYKSREESEEFLIGSIEKLNSYLIAVHCSYDIIGYLSVDHDYDSLTQHPLLKTW